MFPHQYFKLPISHKDLKSYWSWDRELNSVPEQGREEEEEEEAGRKGCQVERPVPTVTLCCPVRLGGSHSSWVSDTVTAQGVSPISTV